MLQIISLSNAFLWKAHWTKCFISSSLTISKKKKQLNFEGLRQRMENYIHLTDQTQPNPLVEIVSVAAFPLKQQICVAATEISWLKVLLFPLVAEDRGKSYPHWKKVFKAIISSLNKICSLFFLPLSHICLDRMKQMLINS